MPDQWRDIVVVPIPKAGNVPGCAPKLRPISLMSCLCKNFHLMIGKRIEWFIEKNNVLSKFTHGFRRGQSRQFNSINNTSSHSLLFTFGNAYNNLMIEGLIKLLDNLNIGKKICQYFWNFLIDPISSLLF